MCIRDSIKYRLKYKTPYGQNYYHPPVPKLTASSKSLPKNALQADNKGRVRVKYQLEEDSSVSFQIFHATSKKEVFNNRLPNQAAKNYLKSLDISQLPKGDYVLVVKADTDEIERFKLVKN